MFLAVVNGWKKKTEQNTEEKAVQTDRDLCLDAGSIMLTDNYTTVRAYMQKYSTYATYPPSPVSVPRPLSPPS